MFKQQKQKRSHSFFLILALLFSVLFSYTLYEFKSIGAQDWISSGKVASSYAGGNGTASNPYLIETGAQLAKLSKDVKDKTKGTKFHAKLVKNVNLINHEWVPIGTSSKPFIGSFDGNNHMIVGLTINTSKDYAGLFGYASNATIKNFLLQGSISFSHSKNYIGGVVGYGENLEISNISSTVKINVSASSYVGGFAGQLNNSKIFKVGQSNDIKAKSIIGGIVGKTEYTTFYDLYNVGEIVGTAEKVAGIVGEYTKDNGFDSFYFERVYNTGNVSSNGNYVGGIAGYSLYSGYGIYHIEFNNVYNKGNIKGNDNVSGISNNDSRISNVYNSGKITGRNYVAGISSSASSVRNSLNTGQISGNTYVGGIAAKASSVSASGNTGAVSASSSSANYLGGVVGLGGHLSNVYNTGYISGNGDYVGGVLGYVSNKDNSTDLNRAYNAGTVSGKNNRGGIVGHYFADAYAWEKFSNLYNVGVVTGDNSYKKYVGSIVGRNRSDASELKNAYYLENTSLPNAGMGNSGGSGSDKRSWAIGGYRAVTTRKTSAELKKSSILTELNGGDNPDGFEFRSGENGGYPVLKNARYSTQTIDDAFLSSSTWGIVSGVNNSEPIFMDWYWGDISKMISWEKTSLLLEKTYVSFMGIGVDGFGSNTVLSVPDDYDIEISYSKNNIGISHTITYDRANKKAQINFVYKGTTNGEVMARVNVKGFTTLKSFNITYKYTVL